MTTATDRTGVYLKYALFCRETEEGEGDNLSFRGIIDLVDIPMPESPPSDDGPRLLAEVDAHLAFCIAGANAGRHTLEVTIRARGPACPVRRRRKWSGRKGFSSSGGLSPSASR